uniref:Response regulator receiver modulated FAD-dependent pyridine nucleotide-disulphide oxidoreductase n=1 Tax=Solibacter usitatus (strain Ellin6076) TaxID=234267 RepID=Q02BW9_SOLUE
MPSKPVLLAVDDDTDVLRSVESDLRKHYARKFRIVSASSGKAALDVVARLRTRNEAIALFLVDYRMPQMNGIEFLSQAIAQSPDAKRVLLTAYADTEAALRAINEIHLNHYLLKPWNPPDQNLFPVLDDLLEDWMANYHPPFEGIRVVGPRWSPHTYELRAFLAKNSVPYRWLDADTADRDPEVKRALDSLPAGTALPVLICEDGTQLSQPTPGAVAARIGLRTHSETPFYDLVIVGGGPAGLAAAVYGASEGLRTVIIERDAPGGQAGLSSRIENYLGFPSGLSGGDLARRGVAQARRFGAEILSPQQAVGIRQEGPYRYIKLADGNELSCHALLIATGVQWRKLDVPGMAALNGAGVYYGAGPYEANSCDGEDVYVVGGANSAGQAAINFARHARRVIMLIRGQSLNATMSQYLIDEISHTPNIEVHVQSRVVEVQGKERLESISIACLGGEVQNVAASALYIFIGAEPSTEWLAGFVERDERGYLITGSDLMHNGKRPSGWTLDRDPGLLETSVPGVFAVGDVRAGSVKRVASGVGEGSIAIQFVHQYLAKVAA